MMNSFFHKVLEVFNTSSDTFILDVVDLSMGKNFKIKLISEDCIEIDLLDNEEGFTVSLNSLSKIPKFIAPKIMNITRISRLPNGQVKCVLQTVIRRELDVLEVLLKTMKENAVFIVQNNSTRKVCYYINNKVFFINSQKNVHEVIENHLTALPYYIKNFSVCLVERLPEKYNCGSFIDRQSKIAKSLNKEFRRVRYGVGVR